MVEGLTIERVSTSDQVAAALRQKILRDELRPDGTARQQESNDTRDKRPSHLAHVPPSFCLYVLAAQQI
jgi:hypothetical protein